MTKRIFKSIIIVALAVLLLSLVLIMGILYEYFSEQYMSELKSESIYIKQGVEISGMEYFNDLEKVSNDNTRITLIETDGTVIYDSIADPSEMENHADREEIIEALEKGYGESSRYSSTLMEKTVYYAVKMDNGTILRISSTQYSIPSLLLGLLQPIIIIFFIAIVLSAVLASKVAKRVVKPLNSLDFEHPEEIETYDELTPMLKRISKQNKQIKRQMEELTRKQQEFTTITENMSEGLLIVDFNTDILSYNSSAIKLLGAKDISSRQSVLTLNRSESFRTAIDLALSGKHNEQTMEFEGRLYQLITNPVYCGEKVVGAVIVILDVTEKEEREKLRREFTANVSHELKTPLTSISGFAEIIKNGIAQPKDIQHFASNIYDESQRLIVLVGDIIKLSQLDENTTPVVKEKVDLYDIVSSVIQRLSHEAEKNNISFDVNAEHTVINGASQILDEMIYNLCENAIKYNKKNGKVSVILKKDGDKTVLTVSDTGIGIPPGDQDRVFERFYRVDKSHSKEIGGTGLGLSIVKHGAAYHNASISLKSELGNGTSVTITF